MPTELQNPTPRQLVYLARIIALAVLYVAAALGGLELNAVGGFATLAWIPTGISLAAVLMYGVSIWPGIAIGALVANLLTGAPILAALGIGAGSTLEALVASDLLWRARGTGLRVDRVRDVIAFIVSASILSTILSATIGVASLSIAGVVPQASAATTWRSWWLGDAIGDLLVVPLVLAWVNAPRLRLSARGALDAAAITMLVAGATMIVFGKPGGVSGPVPYGYMFFPPLVWTALRFEQRGATLGVFLVALIVVVGTLLGRGPFIRATIPESLFSAQAFLSVMATTVLVLGAAIAEQHQTRDELRRARDAATEANQAKSDFLAVVSHELRTPLNAISGYVDLMQMGIPEPVTDPQRDFLSRVQQSSRHLLSLIEDVLSFAKIEAGRLSVAPQPVMVSDSLSSLESLVAPEIHKKDLALMRLSCDPALVATADPEKLRQILLNLVGNAMKFTPPGGNITVGAERSESNVRIWVTDTGVGIPAEQLGRVFEPFFQAERGTTRHYPGLGLGLSISRDLARAMHGDIELESGTGQGCTATLTLPSG